MTKVKTFVIHHGLDNIEMLETNINYWLRQNPKAKIVTTETIKDGGTICVLLFYKEEK